MHDAWEEGRERGAGLQSLAFAVLAVGASTARSAAAATAKCPSGGTPAPGSTVSGGLEVDGACILEEMTVKGGVYVDPSLATSFTWNIVDLLGSTVVGNVVVNDGSEADANYDFSNGHLWPERSTITGGIKLNTRSSPPLETPPFLADSH
jgi:hypothetical protein